MLIIRSLLFLGCQSVIALFLWWGGSPDAWSNSAAWWPIAVVLTNLVCLGLLIRFYQQEGKNFWHIFRLRREFIKPDLLFLLGFLLVAGPVGYLPNLWSAQWLFSEPEIALNLLVRPLPVWAAIVSFALFPLLQGLVELPTYILYALPRLEAQRVRPWLAVSLTLFFLSAQHIFAPFIFERHFIIYRLVMFLPFAALVTWVLRWRPRLMPYMAVIHALMDISIAVMVLVASK
jgi:hypothetical protein